MAPAPAAARPASKPLAKPSKIRYFKGKAPDAAPESDSDEDDEDLKPVAPEPVKIDKNVVAGGAGRVIPEGGMKIALRDVKIEGGRVVLPKTEEGERAAGFSKSLG
jgi:microfibrillar-associated protein 1